MSATSIDLLLFASTLASASPVGSFGVRAAHSGHRAPMGTWVDPGSNEQRDDAVVALAKRGVVLLGESHDQPEHHRWQLHTIAALFSHRPDIVLGFEMFPRRVQPVLDRWSKGELDEYRPSCARSIGRRSGASPPSSTCRFSILPACTACQCWRSISIGRLTAGLRHKD